MLGIGIGKRRRRVAAVCVTANERGLVRANNEDSLFVDGANTLFCVADGMGGGAEGETASRFVCEEMEKAVAGGTLADRMRAVDEAIRTANARIRAYAGERGFAQMGSTVAALLTDPADARRGAICHVGDTRVYRVRRGSAELLTKDHTIGGRLSEFAVGRRAADLKSRRNPLAHVLTRVIGGDETVVADWRKVDAARGDSFLVCSDGVHDVIADSLIGEILTVAPDLAAASERLRAEIVRNGAPDNFTYVMVRMEDAR